MRPEHVDALAAAVALNIKSALAPVLERLAVAEARLDLAVKGSSQALADLAPLRERVAVIEVRPAVPGPPGEPGEPGKDGADGKDGTPGMTYQGVFQDGKSYEKGDVVTWAGQMYHCQKDATTAKPEEFSRDWQLCVKRGRDAK